MDVELTATSPDRRLGEGDMTEGFQDTVVAMAGLGLDSASHSHRRPGTCTLPRMLPRGIALQS